MLDKLIVNFDVRFCQLLPALHPVAFGNLRLGFSELEAALFLQGLGLALNDVEGFAVHAIDLRHGRVSTL